MGWADGEGKRRGPMNTYERTKYQEETKLSYKLWGSEHWEKFKAVKEDLRINGRLRGDVVWEAATTQYPAPTEFLLAAREAIRKKRREAKQVPNPQGIPAPPVCDKPAQKVTGVEWIDWVFANWSSAQPDPPAPGWLDLLEYYRGQPAEFRKLWTREWRYDRVQKDKAALRAELRREKWQEIRKRKKQAEKAKAAVAAEPHEEQDAELAKTLDTWSKPA